MLQVSRFSLRRGSRLLFDDISFTIYPGFKVGLTGANGSGKTSLLNAISGELDADAGFITRPADWQLTRVEQQLESIHLSALEYVLKGHQTYYRLRQALQEAKSESHASDLQHQFEAIDGYRIEPRAHKILSGLGFAAAEHLRRIESFSGGWRVRIALARALLCPSDLMLLDEPTNHLDLDAVVWLEQWLQQYDGTLILVSHDRQFLDNVVNHILAAEGQDCRLYRGHYSNYEGKRAEALAQQSATWRRQQREIAHIESFINRFRAKATKARQAQSRIKQLQRMEKILPAHADRVYDLSFPEPDHLPDPLVHCESVDLGYNARNKKTPDNVVLKNIQLELKPGQRIGLLGRNGAGKSTLLRYLAKDLEPLNGQRRDARHLNIGYFAQHQMELLRAEENAAQQLQRRFPALTSQAILNLLGQFGFSREQTEINVGNYSGGEKARLVLAMIIQQGPNLLLMDEPTNHLDMDMRLALNIALQNFSGAIVLVSHDRYLLESLSDEFWLVTDGGYTVYRGEMSDYVRWLKSSYNKTDSDLKKKSNDSNRKEQRQRQARIRQSLQPLRQKIRDVEKKMEITGKAISRVEAQLSDPAQYSGTHCPSLSLLLKNQVDFRQQLEQLETTWLSLQEELERQQDELSTES